MARMLGELRCGACARRFWPEEGASALLVVTCPRCGAPHANPDARTSAPFVDGDPDYQAWLRRYWIDEAAPVGVGKTIGLFERVIDGFPVYVVWRRMFSGRDDRPVGRVLVAAIGDELSAPPAPRVRDASVARGGYVFAVRSDEEAWAVAHETVAWLRTQGARPLLALDEAPDPAPLATEGEDAHAPADPDADARLETTRVSCGHCGAPLAATELVGEAGACPFCGSPAALDPALRDALALHRRRLRAARLRAPTVDLGPALRAALGSLRTTGAAIAVACKRCGAPNTHTPGSHDERCGSCAAPLVPSERLMRRAEARVAGAAVGRRARQARARVLRDRERRRRDRRLMTLVIAAIWLLTFGPWAIALLVDGWKLEYLGMVPTLSVTVGTFFGAILWPRRRRQRAQARREAQLGTVAEVLGAHHTSFDELLEWASGWWRDRPPPPPSDAESSQDVLLLAELGFPVAIVAGPSDGRTGDALAGARVLLAAHLPRDVRARTRRPAAAARLAALEAAGLAVELRTGGLALAIPRGANLAVGGLGPIVATLATLAHALGAAPPAGAPASARAPGPHSMPAQE